MGFYQKRIVPALTDLLMRQKQLARYRARVVPAAQGGVLEIGIGSGLNLPFYTAQVKEVVGLDPSPELLAMAEKATRNVAIPVRLLEGTAEAIPLESGSVDTVITTWTMCSIPDVPALSRRCAVSSSSAAVFCLSSTAALPSQACAGGRIGSLRYGYALAAVAILTGPSAR